jgi:hypothetical protein
VRQWALSGGLWIPRAFRLPAFASCAFLRPLWTWPALAIGLLASARPQWGYHVSHRQETLGELASLRRERGTVSARPLTLADHSSLKDVSVTCVPFMHYGASTKASWMCNSVPTFPRRDFGCDSLLSFAFTTCLRPRDYSRRPGRMETGVWCSPGLVYSSPPFGLRHLTYATSCRTNGLITSDALLDYIVHSAPFSALQKPFLKSPE